MPPKKVAVLLDKVIPSSSDAPNGVQETLTENKPDADGSAEPRKAPAHPPTMVMVKEAVAELGLRKGVSSQAIKNYIKQKYASVDVARLNYMVRNSLLKGLDSGVLVRPPSAMVTGGTRGRFLLAPKEKEPKQKRENTDPNVKKAKAGPKKAKETPAGAGAVKKKATVKKQEAAETSKRAKKATTAKGTSASQAPRVGKAADDNEAKTKAQPAKASLKVSKNKVEKSDPAPKAVKRGKTLTE
ncbi:histone H1-beta, late embryonic [Lampris incognitus]|uniref:histone H1-beta, late embryonic n=1 Tax=Lampris incognitus TaxID=2546036 RepID=UPI0024B51E0E|nr:histone H1-beta, late embryonic [Lampris incognitus]